MNKEGYNVKRSSAHLRLLLSNGRTRERKRHVTTTPVKLILTKNSKHQSHLSTKFARTTINSLEELAGLLRPGYVTFHSFFFYYSMEMNITH